MNKNFIRIYEQQKASSNSKHFDTDLYNYCDIPHITLWRYKTGKADINAISFKRGLLLAQFLQAKPMALINEVK